MKKLSLAAVLMLTALLLAGCEVNWFGRTEEVAWYVIAIPVAIVAVVGYVILMTRTYVCPKCGHEFHPRWYQLSVMVHLGRKRLATCQKCRHTGYFDHHR